MPQTKPNPMPAREQEWIDRFWAKVEKSDEGCWTWKGAPRRKGYGAFSINKQSFVAHRISYYLSTGRDPGINLVCHSCDNRICVRPDHLSLGDDKSNAEERVQRFRSKLKLNWDIVNQIRNRYNNGEEIPSLTKEYSFDCYPICVNMIWKDSQYHPRPRRKYSRGGNYKNKLNWDIVRQLRYIAANENLGPTELGRRFGITTGHAANIIANRIWIEEDPA